MMLFLGFDNGEFLNAMLPQLGNCNLLENVIRSNKPAPLRSYLSVNKAVEQIFDMKTTKLERKEWRENDDINGSNG